MPGGRWTGRDAAAVQRAVAAGAAGLVQPRQHAHLRSHHAPGPRLPRHAQDGRAHPRHQPRHRLHPDHHGHAAVHRGAAGHRHRRRHRGGGRQPVGLDQRGAVHHHRRVHPDDRPAGGAAHEAATGGQRPGQREERQDRRRAAQLRDRQVLHQRAQGVGQLPGGNRCAAGQEFRVAHHADDDQPRAARGAVHGAGGWHAAVPARRGAGRDERGRRRAVCHDAGAAGGAAQLVRQQLQDGAEGAGGHGEHL
mmetsp:Transcript_39566/g.100352  ORF Transcript_39566/g.100352 Transcript_39566/m.100352 type:complete len:250 (-) Transcript_39566:51-800(-)